MQVILGSITISLVEVSDFNQCFQSKFELTLAVKMAHILYSSTVGNQTRKPGERIAYPPGNT